MADKEQQFNDGIAQIYAVKNISRDGDMPKDGLSLKYEKPIRYEERTVGVKRFWSAKQYETTINRVIRIQKIPGIVLGDVTVISDGLEEQYKIVQAQIINDVRPKAIDLSLEKVGVKYEIK